MKRKSSLLALCAALPLVQGEGAPDWIHLLPAGEIRTRDGRGPYRVASMAALATLSDGEKLPIDECHAIDKGVVVGAPGRAVGWIVELQSREDGLWGRVEWNQSGQALMEDKAYSGISPVILHTDKGAILRVARASLTNTPNLLGLTALHSEEEDTTMDWRSKLLELLGLDAEADDAAIDAALLSKMAGTAPQSEQGALDSPAVLALQSQLASVSTELNQLRDDRRREAAETFVDGAIAQGRVGIKPLRDEYISLHMTDADKAKKMVEAMPVVGGSTHAADLPPAQDDKGFSVDDRAVMSLMGINEDEYRDSQKACGLVKEAL
jgi:phage I-like protein